LGFDAAEEASLNVNIDQEIEIQIASLSGIFLLKITAWKDRNHKSNKDADDIGFILENYLSINDQRAAENHYEEVYADDQTIITGSAALLGIDVSEILKEYPNDLATIKQIIIDTVDKKERSILINQIIETHKTLSYKEVLESLQNIINQLN
jgi:predicted nucleotidyltransferase